PVTLSRRVDSSFPTRRSSDLSVCYQMVGVKPGDEVMMPTMTFVATANAAHHLGAIPHFFDVNEDDLSVDLDKLKKYFQETLKFKIGRAHAELQSRENSVCRLR